MENPHTTHLAAGGSLLGFGGAGLIALLIYQATPKANAWGAVWFLTLFAVLGLLTLFGAYLFAAATYVGLPLPTTRYERENAPILEMLNTRVIDVAGSVVRFELGFINRGRLDIRQGVVTVAVPADFVAGLARCDKNGTVVSTASERVPESLYRNDEPDHGDSLVWVDRDDFPGRTSRPMYFTCEIRPTMRDFRVGYSVVAAELKNDLRGIAEVSVTAHAPPAES